MAGGNPAPPLMVCWTETHYSFIFHCTKYLDEVNFFFLYLIPPGIKIYLTRWLLLFFQTHPDDDTLTKSLRNCHAVILIFYWRNCFGHSAILMLGINCNWFALVNVVQSLLGGHLAPLFHSSYGSVGGCDRAQHLQASDAQGQTLRGAGRTSTAAAAHVEVHITLHTCVIEV